MHSVFIKAFLGVLLASFLATAAYAVEPGCNDGTSATNPGNTGGLWGVMKNQGDAYRVRDKAYEAQVVKQSDSALGTASFEKSIVLSTRLGEIYSDILQSTGSSNSGVTNLSNAIGAIFGAASSLSSLYSDMGASKTLGEALSNVIDKGGSGTLTGFLAPSGTNNGGGNFDNSISAKMGYTLTGALSGLFDGLIGSLVSGANGIISQVQSVLNDISSVLNSISSVINDIDGYLDSQVGQMVTSVLSSFAIVQDVLNYFDDIKGYLETAIQYEQQIQGYVNVASTYVNNAGQVVPTIMGAVQGYLNSITGPLTSLQQSGANGLKETWFGNGSISGLVSGPVEPDTPYFTYQDLLTGAVNATSGSDLMNQITNTSITTNNDIITKAKDDLQNLLNAPSTAASALSSWKPPATISTGAPASQVLCLIQGGTSC